MVPNLGFRALQWRIKWKRKWKMTWKLVLYKGYSLHKLRKLGSVSQVLSPYRSSKPRYSKTKYPDPQRDLKLDPLEPYGFYIRIIQGLYWVYIGI